MQTDISRPEYPRPDFQRPVWLNLNGEWDFEFDDARTGLKEKWFTGQKPFSKKIRVPFAYQSELSGIGDRAFHDSVWYCRRFILPEDFCGKRVFLHFGAVDYLADVWVNGQHVTSHEGGHTPFHSEITHLLEAGENTLVVKAEDFSTDITLPRGKQYWKEKSEVIWYTNTTGIWQTVWLEAVGDAYIETVRFTPHIDTCEVELEAAFQNLDPAKKTQLKVEVFFDGSGICEDFYQVKAGSETRTIRLHEFNEHHVAHLWTPEKPHLYDVKLTLLSGGESCDEVASYFGMRKVSVEKGKLCLNNRPYYLKLVLDQGYFPDGILTPPSDEAIRKDIELTRAMGFNGVRKHQKVEDPRFLYWCDRLGLIVWGEMANALDFSKEYIHKFTKEWMSVIDRDYSHPCIIAWVPLNESWGVPKILTEEVQQHHAIALYHLTKSLDSTRPVVSNDGWELVETDLCNIHDYEWRQDVLEERYNSVENAVMKVYGSRKRNTYANGYAYKEEPILVSEFGGIAFKKSQWDGWGYSGASTEEDFLERLRQVVAPLLKSPVVQGFCYTQLTDVEQEINGLLTYDRVLKAPVEKIREIFEGKGE